MQEKEIDIGKASDTSTVISSNPSSDEPAVLKSIKAHYEMNQDIERLSNTNFRSIITSFINLKIIMEKDAKIIESNDQNFNEKESIDVADIFKFRTENDNSPITKIFIYGAAGSGKSTLCQSIAVKVAQGDLFKDKFDVAIWLPLSKLVLPTSINHYSRIQTLAEIVKLNCASDEDYPMPKVEEIASYLEKDWGKILFILDGFDEVQHSLTNQPLLKNVLSFLLFGSTKHVILTSRPQYLTIDNKPLKSKLSLENVGFTEENIAQYIKKFYPDKAKVLINAINNNSSLKEIARIPLNLEIICELKEFINEKKLIETDYTLTQLYSEMINELLDYNEVKESFLDVSIANDSKIKGKEKLDNNKQINKAVIIKCLAKIALWGIKNRAGQISIKKISPIIKKQAKIHELDEKELLDKILNVGIVKVINAGKKTIKKNIYFIHHTFGEYLAAKALFYAFLVEGREFKKVAMLLQDHKYDPYYELALLKFWDVFENEPRELIGIKHANLAQQLLRECKADAKDAITSLRSLMTKVINPELIIKELITVIDSDKEPTERIHAMNALVELQVPSQNIKSTLEKVMVNDEIEGVRLYAAFSLVRIYSISKLSKELTKCIEENLINAFEKVVSNLFNYKYDEANIKVFGITIAEFLVQINSSKKDEAVKYINDNLNDTENNIRNRSLRHLGNNFALQGDKKNFENSLSITIKDSAQNLYKVLNQTSFMEIALDEYKITCKQILTRKVYKRIIGTAGIFGIGASTYAYIFMNHIPLRFTNRLLFAGFPFEYPIKGSLIEGLYFRSWDIFRDNKNVFATFKILSIPIITFTGPCSETDPSVGIPGRMQFEILKFFGQQLIRIKYSTVILSGVGIGILIAWYSVNRAKSVSLILNDIISKKLTTIEVLEEINLTVENDKTKVIQWSKEGLLDLSFAISLYSYSCNTAYTNPSIWLEPIKDIKFIYKHPNILLTIEPKKDDKNKTENIIVDLNAEQNKRELTTTSSQTIAVLQAMKTAFVNAKLPTHVFDHYLGGTCLDVSGNGSVSRETTYFIHRCMYSLNTISNLPQKAEALRAASAEGDIERVRELLRDKTIDIDDKDPKTGNTALIVAAENKHWEVMKELAEYGADVSFSNENYKTALHYVVLSGENQHIKEEWIKYLISKSFLNEGKLQNILIKAVEDYKVAKNPDGKEAVLNQLAIAVTGEDRSWRIKSAVVGEYRMNLEHTKNMVNEYIGSVKANGEFATDGLRNRLHTYLELFIKLTSKEIKDDSVNISKLYKEIKILIQTYIGEKLFYNLSINFNLPSDFINSLKAIRSDSMIEQLKILQKKEEYVIRTGSAEHCIYVAFYKWDESKILIRVDNRYLTGGVDFQKHGIAPWINENNGKTIIKSYCLTALDLEDSYQCNGLVSYIQRLLNSENPPSKQNPYIYGKQLSNYIVNSYKKFPNEIQKYIETWPYHNIQESATNNCTLSSYNLGISVRHGMEFFNWLIDKELQLAPSLINNISIVTKQNFSLVSRGARLKGGVLGSTMPTFSTEHSYTHVELMKKFQKELKVDYSEVYIGTAVEQALVKLASISTSQAGASFRQYDDNNTIFHLKFTDNLELQQFLEYYKVKFPGLIDEELIRTINGQTSIIMNTKILYNKVSVALSEFLDIAKDKREHTDEKFI